MLRRVCVIVVGVCCAAGCAKVSVNLDGLPCDDEGECLPGFHCNSDDLCEPDASNGCVLGELATCGSCEPAEDCSTQVVNATPICASVSADDFACDYDGSCAAGFADADTNRANGCECELAGLDIACNNEDEDCDGSDAVETGTMANCNGCGNDCGVAVLNASGATCTGTACNYSACTGGFGDANEDRTDGCECAEGGAEVCDNIDNDCDGVVDDGVANCGCNYGVASAEICDGIDNDCNLAIDDTFACTGGELRDCDSGGGAGSGSDPCDPVTCTWTEVCTVKDTEAPAQVTGFAATPGDDQVAMTWDYPNDTDLALCQVRRATGATAPADHTAGDLIIEILDPTPGGLGSTTDASANNQVEYSYAVFCRDSSGNWQDAVGAGNSGTATPVGAMPAGVIDLDATDGDDGQSTISFTMPAAPVDQCAVMRATGSSPTSHLAGDAVGTFTGSGAKSTVDSGLANGTTYYYAVFCENGGTWNDALTGGNEDTGAPVGAVTANPTDVDATDGDNGSSTVTFTTPAGPFDGCVLMRKTGGYPAGHADGDQVGGVFTTASHGETVVDNSSPLTNGTTYFYAVFCENGGTWNDSAAAGNRDTGLPIALAASTVATDGVAGQSNIGFNMPAGATTCKIVRRTGAYPANDSDGTQVGANFTGGGAKSTQDTGLDDGTTYYYAVFCEAGDGYRNTTVVQGQNGDTRTPPVACTPTSLAVSNSGGQSACGSPIDVTLELDGCAGRAAELSCSAQSVYLEWTDFGANYGVWADTNGTNRQAWIDYMPSSCPTSGTFVRLAKDQDNVYLQLGSAVGVPGPINMTGYKNLEVEFLIAYRTQESPQAGENITLSAECCAACTPSAFTFEYPNEASGGSDACRTETAVLDSSLDDCPNLMLRFDYPDQSNARAAIDDIGVRGELNVPAPSDDGGGSYSTSVESCYVLDRDVTCTWNDTVNSPISDTTTVSFQ